MEHGRETQSPYESDNPFIYKQLKLIRFRHNPLKMSSNAALKLFMVSPSWRNASSTLASRAMTLGS
jgi:hypothetical protein